jgi:uncharacterized protein (TIGR02453 family)
MPAYFTPDLFRFLARLKRHNNRDWFLAHKEDWENFVRQPVLQFITDFAAPLSELAPHLVADPRPSRGSMFRIYRDTRFSHDKRPYKAHVAMRFAHRGKTRDHPHLRFDCLWIISMKMGMSGWMDTVKIPPFGVGWGYYPTTGLRGRLSPSAWELRVFG